MGKVGNPCVTKLETRSDTRTVVSRTEVLIELKSNGAYETEFCKKEQCM